MRSEWLRVSTSVQKARSGANASRLLRCRALSATTLHLRYYSSTAKDSSSNPPTASDSPSSIPPTPPAPLSSTSVSSSSPSTLPPSNTAIHPSILEKSPKRRELSTILSKLRDAYDCLNTSQAYLATKQLEQEDPLLRISIVGLERTYNKEESDCERIAKFLLLASDSSLSISEKETEWERLINNERNVSLNGFLIRYGPKTERIDEEVSDPPIIQLPHPLLQPKLELVVSNLDSSFPRWYSPLEPEVFTSKMGIAYSVNRAIIVVRNLEELLSKKILWEAKGAGERDRVKIVVDVDKATYGVVKKLGDDGRIFICSSMVQEALDSARRGNGGVEAFRKAVEESGILRLVEDIKVQTTTTTVAGKDPGSIPGYLKQLILTVISTPLPEIPWDTATSATSNIHQPSTPGNSKKELQEAVSSWSRASHTELTTELDAGYSQKPYTRLRWWKLLWNVDDVRCACEGVIRAYFLRDAERKSWYLAGRVAGAGYPLPEEVTVVKDALSLIPPEETSPSETSINANGTTAEATTEKDADKPSSHLERSEKSRIVQQVSQPQYPSHILEARGHIIATLILPLHKKAQAHLAKFLSGATLASATGVLMLMSEFSMYSSLSVFSLLGVWSLRRLQVGWGRSKREWEMNVRDEGRKAIAGVESWMGACLSNEKKGGEIEEVSGKSKEERKRICDEDIKKRNEVYMMIGRAEKLLEEL